VGIYITSDSIHYASYCAAKSAP